MNSTMFKVNSDFNKNFKQIEKEITKLLRYLSKLFKKYKYFNDDDRTRLINQDIISERFVSNSIFTINSLAEKYSIFLKGSLDENFKNTVKKATIAFNAVLNRISEISFNEFEEFMVLNNTTYGYDPLINIPIRSNDFVNDIQVILQNSIIENKSFDELKKQVMKRSSLFRHFILQGAWSEHSRVVNTSLLIMYDKLGIEKVQWLDATEQIDVFNNNSYLTMVCDKCRDLATGGKYGDGIYELTMFNIKKDPSLYNADFLIIPAHPKCRCIVVPVI